MKRLARLTLALAVAGVAVPAMAGDVKVSFSNGLVTIVATDSSPKQILAEWARQGQVRITNLDRLTGGPVTVQMTDVPEAQALETLLRGTAGYVAEPRVERVVAASSYDRILLMPGVAPAAPAAGASSQPAMNMGGGRGRQSNLPAFNTTVDEDSETLRQLLGSGAARDGARSDPYRQPGSDQIVMPGIMAPSAAPSGSSPGSPATTRQAPAGTPAAGAATPGVLTAAPPTPPPQPNRMTPYSTDGPIQEAAPAAVSSPVPGQVVGQPAQTVGTPASTTFRNPYGLPEPVRPPVVNPNANPYGLTAPVKTTPPTTTPPGPIKKSGADGGQG